VEGVQESALPLLQSRVKFIASAKQHPRRQGENLYEIARPLLCPALWPQAAQSTAARLRVDNNIQPTDIARRPSAKVVHQVLGELSSECHVTSTFRAIPRHLGRCVLVRFKAKVATAPNGRLPCNFVPMLQGWGSIGIGANTAGNASRALKNLTFTRKFNRTTL